LGKEGINGGFQANPAGYHCFLVLLGPLIETPLCLFPLMQNNTYQRTTGVYKSGKIKVTASLLAVVGQANNMTMPPVCLPGKLCVTSSYIPIEGSANRTTVDNQGLINVTHKGL